MQNMVGVVVVGCFASVTFGMWVEVWVRDVRSRIEVVYSVDKQFCVNISMPDVFLLATNYTLRPLCTTPDSRDPRDDLKHIADTFRVCLATRKTNTQNALHTETSIAHYLVTYLLAIIYYWLKYTCHEIQDKGLAFKSLNRCNLAADCSISLKFGTVLSHAMY